MGSSKKGKPVDISGLWNKARKEQKDNSFGDAIPLDAGKYNFQIVSGTIGDFGGQRQVMMKFCVVGDCEDEGDKGKICTMWLSLAEDRIVWLARIFATMGVDLDETSVETESDIQEIMDTLVEAQTVCAGKVREKDGYTNMYLNALVNIDSDDLVDPEDVLKSGGKKSDAKPSEKSESKKGKGKDEDEDGGEDPEGEEVAVGDRVSWKDGKKTLEGEIVSFDKDDNAVIKPDNSKVKITMALDEIEKIGGEEEGEEGEEEEGEEDGDGEERVMEAGDVVIFQSKGKSKSGVVEKIKSGKAHIRAKGFDSLVIVDVDDLKFAVD